VKKSLPGHILKAFRSIERFIPVVDLIIELVDARLPQASRIEGLVRKLDKPSLIVLGKADLADPEATRTWIEHHERVGQPALALNAKQAASVKQLSSRIRQVATAVSTRLSKCRRLMVIGIPNVGKSTLINALAGRKAARVANLPGVTRSIQWVKLHGELELLDLPGVLDFRLLRQGEILRLINTLPGQTEDIEQDAVHLLDTLRRCGKAALVPDFSHNTGSTRDFLPLYAAAMNFRIGGGAPDLNRAATDLIKRFQSGGFGRVTLETPDALLRAPEMESAP